MVMMATEENKFAREVLGLLDDMLDAINDAIASMELEDITQAKMSLTIVQRSAETALDILTPDTKED
jgi:hypothetical protein